MEFTKMRGLGNDYVYTDYFSERVAKPEELAIRIADRHFDVDGDGLILICPSGTTPVRVHMFNADGSKGGMCGNDACCVACYVYDHGLVMSRSFDIETGAGTRHAEVGESLVIVDMRETVLDGGLGETITASGKAIRMAPVNAGNPHAIHLVDSLGTLRGLDLDRAGPAYEHHPCFPEGVNSKFPYIKSPTKPHMRVYERDGEETFVCGTGATAVTFAVIQLRRTNEKAMVHLLGDDPMLEQLSNEHFRMTGSAVGVFSGSYFSE